MGRFSQIRMASFHSSVHCWAGWLYSLEEIVSETTVHLAQRGPEGIDQPAQVPSCSLVYRAWSCWQVVQLELGHWLTARATDWPPPRGAWATFTGHGGHDCLQVTRAPRAAHRSPTEPLEPLTGRPGPPEPLAGRLLKATCTTDCPSWGTEVTGWLPVSPDWSPGPELELPFLGGAQGQN